MSYKRKKLIQANSAEILRSHQRDNQFVRILNDHFQDIIVNYKFKNKIGPVSTETAMKLLYFVLTHGMGNQTLGEEYTGIVPVKLNTLSIQPLSMLTVVSLTECFGESFVMRLIERSLKWINSSHCSFTVEAVDYFNKLLQIIKAVIPMIKLFHQGIFYITGKYSTIEKRIFNIDYAKVYGRRATQNVNWGLKLLGVVMIAQCSLRLWQMEFAKLHSNLEESVPEKSAPRNKNTMKCNLCLERKSTTTTVCGHLFCWFCIVEWLQSQHNCPQCREPISPSRIIYLMNL